MTDLTDALERDDDTGRMARDVLTQPAAPHDTEIKALRIAHGLHVDEDRRTNRLVLGAFGVVISLATALFAHLLHQSAEDARRGEMLVTIVRDLDRIAESIDENRERINALERGSRP